MGYERGIFLVNDDSYIEGEFLCSVISTNCNLFLSFLKKSLYLNEIVPDPYRSLIWLKGNVMERVKFSEDLEEFNIQPPSWPDKYENANRTVYNPDLHPGQAYLAGLRFGMDRTEMAELFGIALMTFDNWMRNHPTFKAAVQSGRDVHDGEKMEKALRDLALGYSYEEKEFTRVKIPINGNRIRVTGETKSAKFKYGMALTKTIKKRHKPDGKALIFWLTNRMKDRWANIKQLEVSGQITEKRSYELIVELRMEKIRELDFEQLTELRSAVSKFTDAKLIDDRSDTG